MVTDLAPRPPEDDEDEEEDEGITIDEALDRNKELRGELIREGRIEKANAVQLGIEALKEIKAARTYSVGLIPETLPGETKE